MRSEAIRAGLRSTRYAWPTLATAVVLFTVTTAVSPAFVAPANWPQTVAAVTPFVLLALAQAAPVLAGGGGIDLSVGPLAGLVNAVLVAVIFPAGLTSPVLVVPLVLAMGAVSGLLNGLAVAVLRVPPIIATLGTYLVYSGLTLQVLPTPGGRAPGWLAGLAGSAGPVPAMYLVIALVVAGWAALMRTAYRRNLIAVGSDERAAFVAGVNTAAVRAGAYVISGVIAGACGLAVTAVLGSGDPGVSSPYTLQSVAAVALGGVALTGGRGGLLGAGLGGVVLFLAQDLLSLAGVSVYWLQVAYGVIVLAALVVNFLAAGRITAWRRLRAAISWYQAGALRAKEVQSLGRRVPAVKGRG